MGMFRSKRLFYILFRIRSYRYCIILCILSVFMLCSWVDPDTVDVYSGQIAYADTQGYNVQRLSGDIDYWLSDYQNLGYDSFGYLFNTSNSIKLGRALISGNEYDIRVFSQGGFQIEQQYTTAQGQVRSVWISYNLTPELLPSPFTVPEVSIIFLVIIMISLLVLYFCLRGL